MIYGFSDSHIDDGTGDFSKSGGAKALNDFLDMVGEGPLVGVGDIVDLWAWKWVEIANGPNGGLVSRLRKHPNFTYILGNHDLQPELIGMAFPRAAVEMSMAISDFTVFHGFQCDPKLNSGWKRWLVEEADELTHELNNPDLNRLSEYFAAGDQTNLPLIEALNDTGGKYILGHSHHPCDIALHRGGRFVNCGCWITGDPHYVTVDEAENVTLCKWRM